MTILRPCRWWMSRRRPGRPSRAAPPRPATEHASMSARRPKGLSEYDRALWRAYTVKAQVTPLPGRMPEAPPAPPAPAIAPTQQPAPTRDRPAPPPSAPRPPPELHIGAAPGGLDARRWRDLRRGRTRPDRTLDLHGRRAQDAYAAVRRFLAEAQADGLRCVAIVTGKGSVGQEPGLLRRELPHWLNAPELRHLLLGATHAAAGK